MIYWDKLKEGGEESYCGWLRDKSGLSWQVTPAKLGEMMTHPDKNKVTRVTAAFMQMRKFDLAILEEEFAKL